MHHATPMLRAPRRRPRFAMVLVSAFTLGLASLIASAVSGAHAVTPTVTFLGVAAGDASSTNATVWTRAVDGVTATNILLTLQITVDPTFLTGVNSLPGIANSTKDHTCKLDLAGLNPNTVYYYRFVGAGSEQSIVGRFKTAPDPAASAPVHFAFSGDNDGLIRPYIVASSALHFYYDGLLWKLGRAEVRAHV